MWIDETRNHVIGYVCQLVKPVHLVSCVGKLIEDNANRFLRTVYVMMKSNLAVTGEDDEHVQDYDLVTRLGRLQIALKIGRAEKKSSWRRFSRLV